MRGVGNNIKGLGQNIAKTSSDLARILAEKVRKDEARIDAQQNAAAEQAKLNAVTADELEKEIDDLEVELPGLGQIAFAAMVAIAVDILGFLRISGSLWLGPIIDVIALALINFSMGFKKYTFFGSLSEMVFDGLQPWGMYISMAPIHTGAIALYYFKHKKGYARLWKLKQEEVELGVRHSSFMQLGNNSIIGSIIVFVVILGVFILPVASIAGFDNGPGNAIVSKIPLFQGLKESGRIENLLDYGTVASEQAVAGFNPITSFMNFWNGTLYNLGGGNTFTTRVETNQDGELGVEIRNFDVFNYNPVDSDLEFSYFVTGKTFIETNSVVRNSCRLEKSGKQYLGVVTPEIVEILSDYPTNEIIFCNVPVTKYNLESGSYRAIANSTYDFEVWSYIPYTFMSLSNLRAQGTNVNSNLDIDKSTKSLSTNGPIIIAISELGQNMPQPYPVREDQDTAFSFSFQLQNKDGGKLKVLDRVILQIPKGMQADKCSDFGKITNSSAARNNIAQILVSESGVPVDSLTDYNLIMFSEFKEEIYDENYNKDIDFRCRLIIPKDGDFLKAGPKTIATVVVSAKYVYEIEQSKVVKLDAPLTLPDEGPTQ